MAEILVVEDEGVVAKDIARLLARMGHSASVVTSAEGAVEAAARAQPDLVLMDIRIKGELDGIACAHILRERFRSPIVYLTAHADEETVARAAATEPFGYVIKPFHARTLQSTIEIALYKHQMETRGRDRERWLATLLHSLGDAVIAFDPDGRVRFLNAAAETLTGFREAELRGQPISAIVEDSALVTRAMTERRTQPLPTAATCATKNQGRKAITGSVAPLIDASGALQGSVLLARTHEP